MHDRMIENHVVESELAAQERNYFHLSHQAIRVSQGYIGRGFAPLLPLGEMQPNLECELRFRSAGSAATKPGARSLSLPSAARGSWRRHRPVEFRSHLPAAPGERTYRGNRLQSSWSRSAPWGAG